jgi:hypothetical protein
MDTYDYRITAARNFLATAPDSDVARLLADVLEVADDFQATDLDESVTKVTTEGGIYIAPADVSRLCPSCRTLAIRVVTMGTWPNAARRVGGSQDAGLVPGGRGAGA